jgi:hypothetical protein
MRGGGREPDLLGNPMTRSRCCWRLFLITTSDFFGLTDAQVVSAVKFLVKILGLTLRISLRLIT